MARAFEEHGAAEALPGHVQIFVTSEYERSAFHNRLQQEGVQVESVEVGSG